MSMPKIGEILCEMGAITLNEAERIVAQQKHSRQKFGQIAIRWGLATPQEIWQAWAIQLSYRRQPVDLNDVGIDTLALQRVTLELARRIPTAPLRLWGDNLVVALPQHHEDHIIDTLISITGCRVYVCTCEPDTILHHLDSAAQALQATAPL